MYLGVGRHPIPDPAPITGPTPRTLADQIEHESRRRPAAATAAEPAYGRTYAPAPSHPGGSRTGVLVAAALVVVLALAGLAVWALASGGDGSDDGHDSDISTEVEQPGGTDGGNEGTTATSGGRTRTTPPPTGANTTEEQLSGDAEATAD